jgi:endonuclease/exonuclease/phosphatase family metal-dependent hydrolase
MDAQRVSGLLLLIVAASGCGASGETDLEDLDTAEWELASDDVVLHAKTATVVGSLWQVTSDTSAAGGQRLWNPNADAAKVTTPLAAPSSYAELKFYAAANKPYHLWMRLKGQSDGYSNDSLYAQFSDSLDMNGNAVARIGSTSGLAFILEQCSGAGIAGWGWNDNGWCGVGVNVKFATTGQHTIRLQRREDGVSVDQIVLSPSTYLTASPGALKNDTTKLPSQDGSAPTASTLKVVAWNVEDGGFRAAGQNFLVQQKPHVAMLLEVDSDTLVNEVIAKLEADQGGTWDYESICRGTDSCASKVVIVSKYPLSNIKQLDLRTAGTYAIPCYSTTAQFWPGRRALGANITVNGRTLSVFSVRTSSSSALDCVRNEEVTKLEQWASTNYALPHIFAGDFNQHPDDQSTQIMTASPLPNTDSWLQAVNSGGAIPAFATLDSTPDKYTPTRTARIDYVFYTQGTPYLSVDRVDIIDSGGLSDHRAMETTFDVH